MDGTGPPFGQTYPLEKGAGGKWRIHEREREREFEKMRKTPIPGNS
jgi:hypothetical protein